MKLGVAVLLACAVGHAAEVNEWVFEASGWGGDYGKDQPFSYLNVEADGVLPGQGEGIATVDVDVLWAADYLYAGSLHALFNGEELFSVGGLGGRHQQTFYIPVTLGTPFGLQAFSDGYFGGHATPYGVYSAFVYSSAAFKVTAVAVDNGNEVMFSRFASSQVEEVPEPATLLLSGLGFLALWFWASSRVRA